MSVKLKDHQLGPLSLLQDGNILRGGVGSGKSVVALAYYYTAIVGGLLEGVAGSEKTVAPTKPVDLYIITVPKKRNDLEWEEELARFALSKDKSASVLPVKIVVDSWNNIEKYREVRDAFFIFDEQRAIGGGSWAKCFIDIAKANRWIMLTATPGDTWIEYVPIFVVKGFFKNRTEFINKHVVFSRYVKFPKIERYVDTAPLHRYRRSVIVDMPFERTTVRKIRTMTLDYDEIAEKKIWVDRWHILEERPLRDIAETLALLRKVVNSDVSRMGAFMQLTEKHPRIIVFYNFLYELEILRGVVSSLGLVSAEWNGQKHEPVPTGEKWVYLVQYTAGSEAWNCITTDTILFYSLNYSWKVMEQCKGRTDRMNTPYSELYYYIFSSNSIIDKGITKALGKKQTFNEKIFEKSGGF